VVDNFASGATEASMRLAFDAGGQELWVRD
jgi:hypothetical protein